MIRYHNYMILTLGTMILSRTKHKVLLHRLHINTLVLGKVKLLLFPYFISYHQYTFWAPVGTMLSSQQIHNEVGVYVCACLSLQVGGLTFLNMKENSALQPRQLRTLLSSIHDPESVSFWRYSNLSVFCHRTSLSLCVTNTASQWRPNG